MLDSNEIKLLFHILDNLCPDLEQTDTGRIELKPEGCREYLDNISFHPRDFRALEQLRAKIQGELTRSLFPGKRRITDRGGQRQEIRETMGKVNELLESVYSVGLESVNQETLESICSLAADMLEGVESRINSL